MFGIGMQELIIIAIIALIVVGPKKLPDLAKTLGKGFSEFCKAADGISDDIKKALRDEEKTQDDGWKESLLNKKSGEEVKSNPDNELPKT